MKVYSSITPSPGKKELTIFVAVDTGVIPVSVTLVPPLIWRVISGVARPSEPGQVTFNVTFVEADGGKQAEFESKVSNFAVAVGGTTTTRAEGIIAIGETQFPTEQVAEMKTVGVLVGTLKICEGFPVPIEVVPEPKAPLVLA